MLQDFNNSREAVISRSYSTLDALLTVGRQRIFFSHQSVGFNILDGIRAVNGQAETLNIIETRTPSAISGHALFHSRIGKNMDPRSKIDDFASLVKQELDEAVTIACFKLCYVDITRSTDITSVFSYYQKTMADLKMRFPNIKFAHITVPLTSIPSSILQSIKNMTGKCSQAFFHNKKRNAYNKLLRDHYLNSEPIFDLARYESITPAGLVVESNCKKDSAISLCSEYSSDGGHLNSVGKDIIANEFVRFLANISVCDR